MVRVIRDSGEHLLGVINDILDLAKIEAGHMVLAPGPIRLPDILARIASLHQVAARDKGVSLVTRCLGSSANELRHGDEMRLIQILHNLVGNAVKFTDQGSVTVEIDCAAPDRIGITVRDTGIGMSAAEIALAFDEFTQGTGGSRRNAGKPLTERSGSPRGALGCCRFGRGGALGCGALGCGPLGCGYAQRLGGGRLRRAGGPRQGAHIALVSACQGKQG